MRVPAFWVKKAENMKTVVSTKSALTPHDENNPTRVIGPGAQGLIIAYMILVLGIYFLHSGPPLFWWLVSILYLDDWVQPVRIALHGFFSAAYGH